METIHQWIKRNESQPLDAIVESLIAMGFAKEIISATIKSYINGKE